MTQAAVRIRVCTEGDVAGLAALWAAVFPDARVWNQPAVSIARKRALADDLLFVAVQGDAVLGAVAAGYDGVRGWIYHLAVAPAARRQGIGRALLQAAEAALRARGCPKINLQILADNAAVSAFYARLGFVVEPRISMGKVLT